jgi:hypothetical protein
MAKAIGEMYGAPPSSPDDLAAFYVRDQKEH